MKLDARLFERWRRRLTRRVLGRAALVLGGLLAALALLIELCVRWQPLPEALSQPPTPSLRVLDRGGRFIDEYRPEGTRSGSVALDELPEHVVHAVLAAEDARFFRHPGVDPLAIARATLQVLWHRRVVSGASTITQQLARNVTPRPPGLRGKLREMVIALRIERELDKARILEEYLNRIEFAPHVRGLDAASRVFFDKPATHLDLAEAALLAGLPRGPSLYNPSRGTERAQRRRDRVLERMQAAGFASADDVARAQAQPIHLQRVERFGRAEHFVRALGSGRLAADWNPRGLREVRTTVDARLQATVQGLARRTVQRLEKHDATSAAVLVVDNEHREVLAYVGSPDFWSTTALGQNDGVRARRQPGSTLKPFVYAAAFVELGYTASTLLPDIELHLPTPGGVYSPRNYDGKFHGPVRLREALANSLNVPAVHTAQRVGPQRVLDLLHDFGFHSLDRDGAHYGAAIALGDGEVTLLELAAAYATLAQDGTYAPLRFALSSPPSPARRVLPTALARLLTDILSDPHAREASFGRGGPLELPFPVAVKTGTSKGYRDNWTVGFTREITVAVWVGNFDGRPMRDSSGVTGAAPLFREVMLAAMEGRTPAELVHREGFVEREICPLSGELAGPDCPHRLREVFLPGHTPQRSCPFHERHLVAGDPPRLATPSCPDAVSRVFERYPDAYQGWAERAGRPVPPSTFDPRCPGASSTPRALAIEYPFSGARFTIDPSLPVEQQRILLRARGASRPEDLTFVLDGRRLAPRGGRSEVLWALERGSHRLYVEAAGVRSAPVEFFVE